MSTTSPIQLIPSVEGLPHKKRPISSGYRSRSKSASSNSTQLQYEDTPLIFKHRKDRDMPIMEDHLLELVEDVVEDVIEDVKISNLDNNERLDGENEIVYLNIGGHLFTTDRDTLFRFAPNYFTSLLEGNFPTRLDNKGRHFINRPGKYFEPMLEYMITGDFNVPENLNKKALVREARFYCIEIPLDDRHQSLSYMTDEWLHDRKVNVAYANISDLADEILTIVLSSFKRAADINLDIESPPFLVEDQSKVNNWLDKTEHGKDYRRMDFIDRQKRLYQHDCIVSDEFFELLRKVENQKVILNYCNIHKLKVKIIPVTIHEPGIVNRHYFTIGYKFVQEISPKSVECV